MDLALLEALSAHEQSGRRLYLDILEVATRLERNYGHYFKPYLGEQLYFDGVSRPILDFTKNTYHSLVEKDPLNPGELTSVTIRDANQLQEQDVYDQHDRMVVRGKDVIKLRIEPSDPVRMMDFIVEYIADYCLSRIPAFEKKGRGLNAIFESFLSTEMLDDFEVLKKKDPTDAEYFVSEIFYLIDPLLAEVREFMGPNKWTIFLVRRQAIDLVVDAYLDYRIYVYHERLKQEQDNHVSGES